MIEFSPNVVSLVKEIHSGDSNIYVSKISDEIVIAFKLPPHKKILQFMTLLNISDTVAEKNDIYESIFNEYSIDNSILLHGNIPAGIPQSIVQLMFHLSGAQDINDSINYTNNSLSYLREESRYSPIDVMKRTICMIMPGYTIEDLNKMDLPELFSVYINAEHLGIKRDIIERELFISKLDESNDNKAQSIEEIMKSSNKELHDLDTRHQRANIKDTSQWQKSYQNTAQKFKR